MKTSDTIDELPEHWLRGCSNANRWVNCPGSLEGEGGDSGGFMADVGTLGHKICEQYLTGVPVELTEDDRALLEQLDAQQTRWLKKAVVICIEYIQQQWRLACASDFNGAAKVFYETKIKSEIVEDHGGTCDVTMVTESELRVFDFKFGSVAVDAENNSQVKCYINLAREKFGDRPKYFGTIIQPAYMGAQTFEYTKEQLDEWRLDQVAATMPEAAKVRRADPSWCNYCRLRDNCPEAAKLGVRAVDEFGTAIEIANQVGSNPTPDDVEKLERIVMMHKMASDAYKGASAILKQWYNDGAKLNHFRVTSSNIRSWKKGAVESIISQLTDDEIAEAVSLTLATPAQLQKILDIPKEEFNKRFSGLLQLTSRPSLKAGSKPLPHELANDLPIFEGEG